MCRLNMRADIRALGSYVRLEMYCKVPCRWVHQMWDEALQALARVDEAHGIRHEKCWLGHVNIVRSTAQSTGLRSTAASESPHSTADASAERGTG